MTRGRLSTSCCLGPHNPTSNPAEPSPWLWKPICHIGSVSTPPRGTSRCRCDLLAQAVEHPGKRRVETTGVIRVWSRYRDRPPQQCSEPSVTSYLERGLDEH